jgi:predicted YcjX-like family ATPase
VGGCNANLASARVVWRTLFNLPLGDYISATRKRGAMVFISDIADGIARTIEDTQARVGEILFEPVIRLGVTGLSRSGKTVFITSLIANLLNRGRMPQFSAAAEGRVLNAFLQPQPDDSVPRFDYETHLSALTGPEPVWPESTKSISQLRLSLRVQPRGILGSLRGPRTVHLDIVDYPGEWLLDLPLLDQDFGQWSDAAIAAAQEPARSEIAKPWLARLEASDSAADLDETTAKELAAEYTAYLSKCREAGLSAVAPGRFLMPGDLEGSPALTFAPLFKPDRVRSKMLYAAFERRFEAYKRIVVKPFFRDHFAKIDRQIVLVDALGAINAGPQAVEDLRVAMSDILATFRPGKNTFLSMFLGTKVEKILFAATKADHLHHTQHGRLSAIMAALLEDARRRADYKGAETTAMSIASLRATVELTHKGEQVDCVRGKLIETGKEAALYAGDLPEDPAHLLVPARQGEAAWLDRDYNVMRFAPPRLTLKPGEGPPHIRLDKAAEFLLGDRLS